MPWEVNGPRSFLLQNLFEILKSAMHLLNLDFHFCLLDRIFDLPEFFTVGELFEGDFLLHGAWLDQHVVGRGEEEDKVVANFVSGECVYLRPELFDDFFGCLF